MPLKNCVRGVRTTPPPPINDEPSSFLAVISVCIQDDTSCDQAAFCLALKPSSTDGQPGGLNSGRTCVVTFPGVILRFRLNCRRGTKSMEDEEIGCFPELCPVQLDRPHPRQRHLHIYTDGSVIRGPNIAPDFNFNSCDMHIW